MRAADSRPYRGGHEDACYDSKFIREADPFIVHCPLSIVHWNNQFLRHGQALDPMAEFPPFRQTVVLPLGVDGLQLPVVGGHAGGQAEAAGITR